MEKKVTGNQGRRRFQELRQKMQTDDEDTGLNNTSPPDSQTSSVEGVFAVPSKTSHPFRIIEHDTVSLQSMTSLGRVGRILGGSIDNTGEDSPNIAVKWLTFLLILRRSQFSSQPEHQEHWLRFSMVLLSPSGQM